MKFIDAVNIHVRSGKGGSGSVSFRREKGVPRGGPDGGDGGCGGSIIFRINPNMNTLFSFENNKLYKAPSGKNGSAKKKHGASGKDLILEVPPGTLIKDLESGELVDLENVSEVQFVKGGRGGKGNWHFKSSCNQAPEHFQYGESTQTKKVHLELKLIADVGIVGLPNAGKSTLISSLSRAKSRVANYPFTTLVPQLGVMDIDEERSLILADMPGLIEGASQGSGLGNQFLKHIERAPIFLHLVDISGDDPLKQYQRLNKELITYDKQNTNHLHWGPLSKRKQIVVLNKVDLVESNHLEKILLKFKNLGINTITLSAITHLGFEKLKKNLVEACS